VSPRARWECSGADFNSWIWIDTKDADVASAAVELAKEAGMPIRSGAPGGHPRALRSFPCLPLYIPLVILHVKQTEVTIGM
jgi:hypothetical protein